MNLEKLEELVDNKLGKAGFEYIRAFNYNDENIKMNDNEVTKVDIFFVGSENYKFEDLVISEAKEVMKEYFSEYTVGNYSYGTIESLEDGDAVYEVNLKLKG